MKSAAVATLPISVLMVLVSPASTRADDTLVDAFNALNAGRYVAALSLSTSYIASHPPRFTAAYIRAISLCQLQRYGPGSNEMKALPVHYVLSASAMLEVQAWIDNCHAPVTISNNTSPPGVGVSGQPLTLTPQVKAASPSAPAPSMRPQMGPLTPETSYSGADYDLLTASSATSCSELCRQRSVCRSMTYDVSSGQCWLKRSVPPAQHGPGFISATKTEPSLPSPALLPRMTALVGATSYSGDDYAQAAVASPGACAEMCRVQTQCRSMTFATSSKTCWLKRSVPPAMHGEGFYSSSKQ